MDNAKQPLKVMNVACSRSEADVATRAADLTKSAEELLFFNWLLLANVAQKSEELQPSNVPFKDVEEMGLRLNSLIRECQAGEASLDSVDSRFADILSSLGEFLKRASEDVNVAGVYLAIGTYCFRARFHRWLIINSSNPVPSYVRRPKQEMTDLKALATILRMDSEHQPIYFVKAAYGIFNCYVHELLCDLYQTKKWVDPLRLGNEACLDLLKDVPVDADPTVQLHLGRGMVRIAIAVRDNDYDDAVPWANLKKWEREARGHLSNFFEGQNLEGFVQRHDGAVFLDCWVISEMLCVSLRGSDTEKKRIQHVVTFLEKFLPKCASVQLRQRVYYGLFSLTSWLYSVERDPQYIDHLRRWLPEMTEVSSCFGNITPYLEQFLDPAWYLHLSTTLSQPSAAKSE